MPKNEFLQPVSYDQAPRGSVCEWCGKQADHQLTAIGGSFHNESGFFCQLCGDEFARAVAHSLVKEGEAATESAFRKDAR